MKKEEFNELKEGIKKGLKKDLQNLTLGVDLKKAIKARQIKPLLYFTLVCLSAIALLSFIIYGFCWEYVNANVILMVALLPASIAGFYFCVPRFTKECFALRWYCDNCGSDMDVAYNWTNKKANKLVSKKITGSHYELSNGQNGTLVATEVLDTSTQGTGSYLINGTLEVMLTCRSCSHKQSFTINDFSFVSKHPENYDNEKLKEAILDRLTLHGRSAAR